MDLSRLGRNYIMAGQFCEMYFPSKGVRFIALNDQFDTENESSTDFAGFKHVMNDAYARDTSRKIKSVRKAKAKNGQFVATFAPYGYMKAPDNHNKLIVNEETSPVVRKIFDLYIQGYGLSKIRAILTNERILTPAAYTNKQNPQHYAHVFDGCDEVKRYNWYTSSIREILTNPLYIGHLVTGKQVKPSFKSPKRIKHRLEDCFVTENTHEPIIDLNTWEIAQNTLNTKRRDMKENNKVWGIVNEFAGIIKCADCGRSMAMRTSVYEGKKKNTVSRHYLCNRYLRNTIRQCTYHHIRYNDVYELVLQSVRKYAMLSHDDKAGLARQLAEAGNHQQQYELTQCRKELKTAQKRLPELDRLVMKLYEEYVAERVSGDNYSMLLSKYQTEQAELKRRVEALNAALEKSEDNAKNIDEFIKLIEQHTEVKTLTPEIVCQLIEKIDIYEAEVVDCVKRQRVDIHWRFIGMVDLCC